MKWMTARQVAAKLRSGFGVRYWTVVQHHRSTRAADAIQKNFFVVDYETFMKTKSGPAL
jgi:hypothetical protein